MKNQKVSQSESSPDKRRIVLEALLAGESQDAAARLANASRRTVVRWLAEPGFKAELERARAAAFDEAIGLLKGCAGRAVKKLLGLLESKNDTEGRQAAKELLGFAFKSVETLDFEARLERLEKFIEEHSTGARSGLVS
jgi:hypothetical protein